MRVNPRLCWDAVLLLGGVSDYKSQHPPCSALPGLQSVSARHELRSGGSHARCLGVQRGCSDPPACPIGVRASCVSPGLHLAVRVPWVVRVGDCIRVQGGSARSLYSALFCLFLPYFTLFCSMGRKWGWCRAGFNPPPPMDFVGVQSKEERSITPEEPLAHAGVLWVWPARILILGLFVRGSCCF